MARDGVAQRAQAGFGAARPAGRRGAKDRAKPARALEERRFQVKIDLAVFLGQPARDAARLRVGFPGSLDGAPLLLPTTGAAVRLTLDGWFERVSVRPRVVAEFDDSALMKVFAQEGLGVFPGSAALAGEIASQYGVEPIGRAAGVKERYYVVTSKRRLEHPAIRRLTERARTQLFAPEPADERAG